MTDAKSLNERLTSASRQVSGGNPGPALAEARAVLAISQHPVLQLNCAGLLIDAGQRLGAEAAVRDGIALLEALRKEEPPRVEMTPLLYNLANGKSALLQMANVKKGARDEDVRDFRAEEEVIALYYESSDNLRNATPETVINCAATLRTEGRIYEAIDLLDGVLRVHPDHPNAHMHMAAMLWLAWDCVRGRDASPEALLIAALVHYERAERAFVAAGETMFADSVKVGAQNLRELAGKVLGDRRVAAAIADVGARPLTSGERSGAPLGLSLLARSAYVDRDDPWLVEDVPKDIQSVAIDAGGVFAIGRGSVVQANAPDVRVPAWGAGTPDASVQLRHAAFRQFASVLDKIAWLINSGMSVGIKEKDCSFAKLFWESGSATTSKTGIRPQLLRTNPGLRALAGLARAYDLSGGVYGPMKRLRNSIEHRSGAKPAEQDDAAFMMGIARAALLHAVDAVIFEALPHR